VSARSPAERPGWGAAKAFGATSAEPSEPTDDFLWRNGLARRFRSRLMAGSVTNDQRLLAPAYRSNGGSRSPAPRRGSGRLAEGSLSLPFGWLEPSHVPAYGHPPSLAYGRARRRQQTAAGPARSARDLPRCSLSLSSMWLAVFKMMHRSGERQGCGQLLTAFAAFSSTPRSLTVFGPARSSPRPFGHP
jgi:hypothetical protein